MRLSRLTKIPREAPPKVAPFRNRLIVMIKTPVAGRVKTRLAREIGIPQATSFYRHTTTAVLSRLRSAREWQIVLSVTPDRDARSPARTNGLGIPQGQGDLGERMQRAFRHLPPGPVVLIGSDIPAIRSHHIRAAFKALGSADAVFGPATDGGYWLVGLRRRPKLLSPFQDVRWSSEHALADTLSNLNGMHVSRVATLQDVDHATDLATTRGWLGRRVLPWWVRDRPPLSSDM